MYFNVLVDQAVDAMISIWEGLKVGGLFPILNLVDNYFEKLWSVVHSREASWVFFITNVFPHTTFIKFSFLIRYYFSL